MKIVQDSKYYVIRRRRGSKGDDKDTETYPVPEIVGQYKVPSKRIGKGVVKVQYF